jgi:hypothetical protein
MPGDKESNKVNAKSGVAKRSLRSLRIVPETGRVHELELHGGLRPLTEEELRDALPGTTYTVPAPGGRPITMGWVSIFGPKPGGWRESGEPMSLGITPSEIKSGFSPKKSVPFAKKRRLAIYRGSTNPDVGPGTKTKNSNTKNKAP